MVLTALGGFCAVTGLPFVAWPVSFDGGATWYYPPCAQPMDESKPQIALWHGSAAEYNAEASKEWPAFRARIEYWRHGEGVDAETRRRLVADGFTFESPEGNRIQDPTGCAGRDQGKKERTNV